LIERYYDPTGGEILFSGVNIKKFDPKWFKKQIGIVSQEPVLFTGTIRQNICYGLEDSEVTEADIDDACHKANAYDFIKDSTSFPDGYDTLVGERGVKLSGGQK
jgi:ATP-binding cassette subfamily B (MDR/TAP) protein 1